MQRNKSGQSSNITLKYKMMFVIFGMSYLALALLSLVSVLKGGV